MVREICKRVYGPRHAIYAVATKQTNPQNEPGLSLTSLYSGLVKCHNPLRCWECGKQGGSLEVNDMPLTSSILCQNLSRGPQRKEAPEIKSWSAVQDMSPIAPALEPAPALDINNELVGGIAGHVLAIDQNRGTGELTWNWTILEWRQPLRMAISLVKLTPPTSASCKIFTATLCTPPLNALNT